jgi:hypothetical protein
MKKIIAGFLAAVTILSVGSAAYAATPATKSSPAKLDSSTIANNQAIWQEVQTSRITILTNEGQVNKLRFDIRATMIQVRLKINALRKDKATVTQGQIDAIKTAITSINSERKAFATTHKDIMKNIYPALRDARKSKDYDTIKVKFDAIIAEQQSRIADLQKVLDSINSILNI